MRVPQMVGTGALCRFYVAPYPDEEDDEVSDDF